MSKNTLNQIDTYTAGLIAARKAPADELAKLEAFKADCQQRVNAPIDNVADHVRARLELAETHKAIAEFQEWKIEHRQLKAAEKYLSDHVGDICQTLRAMIVERSKAQPDFIASKLKQAASITLNLFASKTDRQATYQERDAAEQAAADAELVIATATAAVRAFEITPDESHFHAASARVAEIQFPLVAGH